jgi:hypothetical protein
MTDFDTTTRQRAEEKTKYFHKGSYLIPKELHYANGFEAGRNSTRKSLSIALRALEGVRRDLLEPDEQIEAALAAIKARGDYIPAENK